MPNRTLRAWPVWAFLALVLLVAQSLPGEAAGQAPAPKPAPATHLPSAIPVAEVATQAAQVPNLVRTLTEPLAPSASIETIRKGLPKVREQIDLELAAAATILQAQPTLDVIQAQQQLWQQRERQTTEWLSLLTQRATLLQSALQRLADIKLTWRHTREASHAAKAPGPVLAQIDGALAAIDAAETTLAAERTAVLDLQSIVAQEVARSGTMLAQFTQAQQIAMGGILTRDSPPLWAATAWADARAALPARAREIAAARGDDLLRYVREPWGGMLVHLVMFAVLAAVFSAARRHVRQAAAPGGNEPFTVTVFDRPFTAALLVVMLVASSPYLLVPPSVRNLFGVLLLVPVLRLVRPIMDPRLAPPAYTLGALFVLDSIRQAFGGEPVLEQAILALEMLVGMAALGHALTVGALRPSSAEDNEIARVRAFRLGAGLVLVILAVGLVAGSVGYMRLARLLASGLLGSGALVLTLYASLHMATGVVAFILRVWPLRLLQMVQHHRDLLERRAHHVLLWMVIVGWAVRTLDHVGLLQSALSLGRAMLAVNLGRGAISVSVGGVLEFILTIWFVYMASTFIRFVLREDVYPRTQMSRGISYAISSLLNYAILALGFLLALGVLGVDVTKATILAGALGVGIGFGLQSVVNNFVSGLILLFERPIHVGDIVEIGDLQGEVSRIGIRASTVRTWRGAEIIVPNAQLTTERVTNWTLSDRKRRIDLPVGVDYGSPPEKVVELLEAAARAHPHVLKEPAPQAVFIAFADSAITFELRAWTNRIERWPKIQTELAVALHAKLRAAGMTFPFPQREVRVLNDTLAGGRRVLGMVAVALLAAGCATPVGTTRIDIQRGYRLQYANALAAEQPSEASKVLLRRLGLLDRFEDEPSAVLADLHRRLGPAADENLLYALAELSFFHGDRTGDRGYFLASAVYAYALLFPGQGASVQLNQADPRGRLAYDFYNQGLARGLTVAREQAEPATPNVTSGPSNEVRLESGTRTLPFGKLEIELDPSGLTWGGYRLERFISTTNLAVRGLRNRYWHPGLGASLAASLAPEASAKVIGAERIGPRTKVPVTALLRLTDPRGSLSNGLVRGRLEVHTADQASTVIVDGQTQLLEFDTTASLAETLEGNPIYDMEIAGFLRGGIFTRFVPRDRFRDGLAMLWPYRPGKIPVVLVHGTASSPARWAELINELLGDPRIRERFQIWIFIYDSGNPIGYSAGRLRAALTAVVNELDPEGKDRALRRMVVIGHSQGGLLTKLTAIDSGTRFWDAITTKPFDSIKITPETRDLLRQSIFFTPLPQVERVIFVATPHRGALLATGRLGALAAWLVTVPTGLATQIAQAATATGDEALIASLRRPPTAVDNMSPGNRAIKTLQGIPVAPTTKAHSIIAVKGNGPVADGDDGVVAYRSAQIDEAVSQVVVRWGHSVQGHPQAIEEIRRILLEHAATPAGQRP